MTRADDTAAAIAARRHQYQRQLAYGTGQFFMPRRITCPECDSTALRRRLRTRDHVQGKPGIFTLDQCRACRHIFQNPRLTLEGLNFYYRDFYEGLGDRAAARMFGGRIHAKRFRGSVRALMRPGQARPRRWLDVGTGRGYFCATAQEELPDTVFDGLDRSESVERAAKEGRLSTAYRGQLTELTAHITGRYDVVSMFHYLEHTLKPREELVAARSALRPGGYLFIEMPNPESPFGRLLGSRWMPWFQPQHLHLPPMRNLCDQLERNGFTVVSASRTGDQHIPVDLVCATWFWINRVLPREDAPWLAKRPGRAAAVTRTALSVAAAPFVLLAYGLDLVLAPVVRRTPFSNAYRVIARWDMVGP
ncbi:class I SAM-dependent methyltransferase [Streptomyces sp. NPDC020800]|uniref:class I SAM-dependent methyltransferase n=1 Tax=Streptomyces sp. NPDC020800 TaxID=3365092 RepID=UPI00379E5735